MINDLLSNHGGLAGAVVYLLTLILERLLGRVRPLGAASLIDFALVLPDYLLTRFRKGAPVMPSANPNVRNIVVTVDGPTYDAMGVVVSLVKGIASGQKPQEALTAALPAIMASFTQLGQIPGDLALDRASVVEAVSQRLGDLAEAFILAKAAAPVVIPK